MLGLLFASTAFAADAIELELVKYGQIESAAPAVILKINRSTKSVDLQLKCGSQSFSKRSVVLSSGQKITLELPISKGKARCSGTLNAEFPDGTAGSMPLNFGIEMFDALKINIDKTSIDMKAKTLNVKLSRPAARYEVELLDVDQQSMDSSAVDVPKNRNLGPQTLSWSRASGEVAIIRVRAKDVYGFWSSIDLLPWHYDIPHEDVIFESSKAEILPSEEPKLVAVRKEIEAVFVKYEKIAKANLYVAGYTDTVGSANSNLQLSARRAKSIAQWFKAKGFRGKIYYQGFGESALAVPTKDGVDKAENRRALYIVAAEAPPRSADLPKSNWKLLK